MFGLAKINAMGIRGMLTQAKIPTPTSIMADMLALRIAQIAPTAQLHDYWSGFDIDQRSVTITMKIAGDRKVKTLTKLLVHR